MEYYDELKSSMQATQKQIVERKKNKQAGALRELKRLYKEFGYATEMLNGSLAEGSKDK